MIIYNTMKNCVLRVAVGAIAAAYAFVLVAGPEQDFEAAYKEGKPLSAEQAFKQILEKNPNASVDLYYKAAEMATETLKSTLVRTRQPPAPPPPSTLVL